MGHPRRNSHNTPGSSAGDATGTLFGWHGFDVSTLLPDGWHDDIMRVAAQARYLELAPASVTSREAPDVTGTPSRTVDGLAAATLLPWLQDLYEGPFRDRVQTLTDEKVSVAEDMRNGVNLLVAYPGEQYECHVDSNKWQGLFNLTTHPPGTGGALRASNRGDVRGIKAVDEDCTEMFPVAGHLIVISARRNTHYVTPLVPAGLSRGGTDTALSVIRVMGALNFYVPSCPESDRPRDLNEHLFGS